MKEKRIISVSITFSTQNRFLLHTTVTYFITLILDVYIYKHNKFLLFFNKKIDTFTLFCVIICCHILWAWALPGLVCSLVIWSSTLLGYSVVFFDMPETFRCHNMLFLSSLHL